MTPRPNITNTQRVIILSVTALLAGLAIWFFSNMVVFILISFVISMIGEPLVNLLQKIHFRKWHLPRALCSFLVLILFWVLVLLFFFTFIPLLANEFKYFSNIDINSILNDLGKPIGKVEKFMNDFGLAEEGFSLQAWATNSFRSAMGFARMSEILSDFAGLLGSIFITVLSVSFITYYFMKESHLFEDGVVMFFPEDKETSIRHAITSISELLKRYFIGVLLQSTCVMILIACGLLIVGLQLSHAVTIALIAGVLNVIPYVGPFIGSLMAVAIGTAVSMPMDVATELVPRIIYILVVMETTKIIDNVIFQPQIFSRSVKAHPLEIFLIILIAATIGGVLGMLIAIPTYTVLRVIGKEFFNQIKFVQRITTGI
ncbi:MAG: AI-2E family transporter [Bacteroidales bacterium]|jgi:predicted PurR-regulated permease PerM